MTSRHPSRSRIASVSGPRLDARAMTLADERTMGPKTYPATPDGRYFVVRDRLWRKSDPGLDEETRQQLVDELMAARRAVGAAKRAGDQSAEDKAHAEVERTKRALGERGAPWWTDGTPDYNRHLAKNTPYATWYEALKKDGIGENR